MKRSQETSAAGEPRRGGWVLALLPATMLGVLLLRHVWDVDIFWQLRLGELILEQGGPVPTEPFAATHLGEPLPAVAWLGQALFAAARYLDGWTGLRLFDALCWCGGFWALAAACRKRGADAASVALALAAAFLVALATASIRPQTYGVLCFGVLLALLKLNLSWRLTVALGTPLLVLWQNLHPSVSIGAAALGVYAVGGWFAWYRNRDTVSPSAPPWASTILVPIAFLSLIATPDGLGGLAVSARNAQASILVGASEWLPLWAPSNHHHVPRIAALALLAAWALWRAWPRLDWADAAVMVALLVLTVSAYRFVLFWAVATIPVVASLRWRGALAGSQAPYGDHTHAQRAVMVGALVATAVVAPLVKPTQFSDNLPLDAVASLAATDVRGTIFTEPEFGGVLIDEGHPRWLVSYDGRYYRYTDEEWGRFGYILGGRVKLRDVVRRYRPAAFLLRPSHSTYLCNELDRPGSGWRRIYKDEGAAVWIPAD